MVNFYTTDKSKKFYELDIDPSFVVLDEQGAASLKSEAIDVVLKKLTSERTRNQ